MLTSEPVLKTPDFSQPFQLAVEASAIGMGVVLMQIDDNTIYNYINKQKLIKNQVEGRGGRGGEEVFEIPLK